MKRERERERERDRKRVQIFPMIQSVHLKKKKTIQMDASTRTSFVTGGVMEELVPDQRGIEMRGEERRGEERRGE